VPTAAQQNLLYSLKKENEHVLFRSETGTGKSFLLAMYALNQPRSLNEQTHPTTSTLVLVPNPDLAIQYYYWITQILSSSVKDPDKTAKIVQTFFRTDEEDEKAQIERLARSPNPHIVISTPTRMLDMIARDPDSFDVSHLRSIIVDEADNVIQPPDEKSKKPHHRTPGEILLDWIFEKRKTLPSQTFMQFIATSATLTTRFSNFLTQKDWLSPPIASYTLVAPTKAVVPGITEQHVLMVSLVKSPNPNLIPDRIQIKPARLPYVTIHRNVRTKPPRTYEPPRQTTYPPNYLTIPAIQRLLRD